MMPSCCNCLRPRRAGDLPNERVSQRVVKGKVCCCFIVGFVRMRWPYNERVDLSFSIMKMAAGPRSLIRPVPSVTNGSMAIWVFALISVLSLVL